ncbi:MAG: FAD-dependent oxidoreductase, partial [Oscillospiraceae bacterium]|nr:FAD-dependent oxidoreductase [Oscillospiraceae bacterium]
MLSELSAQAWQAVQAGQAAQAVHSGQSGKKAVIMAGGTDLLGVLKDDILPDYPKMVVDIKTIPHDNPISINNGTLSISALTKLKDAAESETVKKYAPALAEAIKTVATPLVRNLGTVGGNICQDVRCWFYRYPHEGGGRMLCSRKGGDVCYALQGDNRYHSVFGGMKAHVTPCIQKCPAATDIPGYMEQIRKGNLEGAAHMIMKVNPMPMITARVCAHFCHDACNRACTDENVNIGGVERALGDYIIEYSEFFFAPPEELTGKSIAVIGSGPSGLAAAYYQRKAGNEVTVFDNMPEAGGMLMYTIPAYRLPKDLVRKYIAILEKMGVKFECNTQIGKDVAPTELEQKFDSVFYATGAWKRPVIGIAGEELTEFGLDFLIEVNKWMKGKIGTEVLVTGGGNVAMDVAITAKRLGARKVTMACLEPLDRMPASSEEIARAKEEGVVIMPSWGLVGVVEEGGAVKGMELKRCTSVWDEKGVFDPQYDDSERIVVNAESILMAVGQQVDLSFLDEKYQIQLNKRGLIDVVEDTGMTSRPGVFAGGDAITGPATVIDSIATGHRASNGMLRYLGLRGAAGSGSAGAAGAGAAGTGSAGAVGAGADAGV